MEAIAANNTLECAGCGRIVRVGDWPFCPHGQGYANVVGDEVDFIQHNGTKTPIRFRSRGEFKRWLKEHQYEVQDSHKPLPGSDKSPFTTDWSRVYDDYTANNVRELMERAFKQKPTAPVDDTIHFRPFDDADIAQLDKQFNSRH